MGTLEKPPPSSVIEKVPHAGLIHPRHGCCDSRSCVLTGTFDLRAVPGLRGARHSPQQHQDPLWDVGWSPVLPQFGHNSFRGHHPSPQSSDTPSRAWGLGWDSGDGAVHDEHRAQMSSFYPCCIAGLIPGTPGWSRRGSDVTLDQETFDGAGSRTRQGLRAGMREVRAGSGQQMSMSRCSSSARGGETGSSRSLAWMEQAGWVGRHSLALEWRCSQGLEDGHHQ